MWTAAAPAAVLFVYLANRPEKELELGADEAASFSTTMPDGNQPLYCSEEIYLDHLMQGAKE
jgi:hypothetical protein